MRTKKIARIMAPLLVCTLTATACSSASDQGGTISAEPTTIVESAVAPKTTAEISGDIGTEPLGYINEMDKNRIMTFEITADSDAWQAMLDNATAKEYISADITINGTTVRNVGIRPKGNSSLSAVAKDDSTDRYSFSIKFDEYVEGQTWLGLDKIVLNNNYSDKTAMKEYLSYDIMSYIGVEAPLFAYANITLNGAGWGFYLAVEDYDSGYLDRTTGGQGELYKPESMQMGNGVGMNIIHKAPDGTYTIQEGEFADGELPELPSDNNRSEGPMGGGRLEGGGRPENGGGPESGERPEGIKIRMGGDDAVALKYIDDEISSYASIFDNDKTKTNEKDHQRVIEALKNLNEGTDLETYVNVDGVLRYLAAHTTVVNLDSYSSNMAHNYILYENEGQINMLPWDYNMAFGGFESEEASVVVNFPVDTPVSGVNMEDRPMISRLLEVPEYLNQYHSYLEEIIDGYFADGQFEKRVDEIDKMIAEYVEHDPTAFFTDEEYQTAIKELKKLGELRGKSIQGQLDGTLPSTTEGQLEEPASLVDASSVELELLGGGKGEIKRFYRSPEGEFGIGGRGGEQKENRR